MAPLTVEQLESLVDKYRKIAEEFCDNVDAVGLERNEDGYASPAGTDGWSDIGETYLRACEALGRKPVWNGGELIGTWEPPALWHGDEEEGA